MRMQMTTSQGIYTCYYSVPRGNNH